MDVKRGYVVIVFIALERDPHILFGKYAPYQKLISFLFFLVNSRGGVDSLI